MFELNTRNEQRCFIQLLNHTRWYDVWKMMNEVKPLHLIPGLNVATIYQLSEYFDVPLRLLKNIETKYHLGDPISRQFVSSDELGFLALSKQRVKFEGVQHWQYDFRDFSIHTAAAGAMCYSPKLIEEFLPYIKGSQVCSDIIRKVIKSFNFESRSYLGLDALKRSLTAYEQSEAEKAKESETKRIVKQVLADMKIEQSPVTIEVMVSI